jgi:hypothetical protein
LCHSTNNLTHHQTPPKSPFQTHLTNFFHYFCNC